MKEKVGQQHCTNLLTLEFTWPQPKLETSGIWSSKVDVSSKLGRVEIDTPEVSVPEARTTIAGSLVFMGVFLCIILEPSMSYGLEKKL
ncbi:MAG: hypothetical protein CM1200mP35_05380 [Chloroflexota bacterium]|nr:MAG: hypothetical protein CM1200mP35_05380 [Chloroflexota bacterium]